jgi:glutamate 5-kinase
MNFLDETKDYINYLERKIKDLEERHHHNNNGNNNNNNIPSSPTKTNNHNNPSSPNKTNVNHHHNKNHHKDNHHHHHHHNNHQQTNGHNNTTDTIISNSINNTSAFHVVLQSPTHNPVVSTSTNNILPPTMMMGSPDYHIMPSNSNMLNKKRIVIKIGTASLLDEHGLKIGQVATMMDTVAALRRDGYDVCVVCSGAVGTGCHVMKLKEKPKNRAIVRAAAAVGQARLIRELNHVLSLVGCESAQILLSYANLGEYDQSLAAQNTMNELFQMNVVPIVNENDTVKVENQGFGDNDRLSALVANVIDADYLFILTDVNGVYTSDPRKDPTAKRIDIIRNFEKALSLIKTGAGAGTAFSTGGMESKISAARMASLAGVRTMVMKASDATRIPEFLQASAKHGKAIAAPFGTVFVEQPKLANSRKKWLSGLPPKGHILVDEGAATAIRERKTLFAAGVRRVTGKFNAGEPIHVVEEQNPACILAVGFPNYGSYDLEKICGKRSEEIQQILGVDTAKAVVDRENLAWTAVRFVVPMAPSPISFLEDVLKGDAEEQQKQQQQQQQLEEEEQQQQQKLPQPPTFDDLTSSSPATSITIGSSSISTISSNNNHG